MQANWSRKSLDLRTCICDCHTPHYVYRINGLAMSSLDLDLVNASISTTINNTLVYCIPFQSLCRSQGHFGVVNCLDMIIIKIFSNLFM